MKPTVLAFTVAATLGLIGCQSSNTDSAAKEIPQVPDKTEKPEVVDVPLITEELYLRGLNGDWGTSSHARLVYQGNNKYETVLRAARGTNGFKIANESWQVEYTNYLKPVELGVAALYLPKPEDNALCMNSDCNSEVTFPAKGYYKFTVSFADTSSAEMIVTEATQEEAQAYYQDAITDPAIVHKGHQQQVSQQFDNFDASHETVTFSVEDKNAALRTFGISSSADLRDALDQGLYVNEITGNPKVVTGDVAFDALFALSLQELDQLAVSEIRDGSYNSNQPIKAEVFETGAKWHYVWTRDLSYAADLSVALLDPKRVRNSLEFKLSGFRDQTQRQYDGEQIIQDTGTGGSWPISTDRVTWALGAERLLTALSDEEYAQFSARAYNAVKNTVEADRQAAFDSRTGLYTGEQSFLDWREQTYSSWSYDDVNYIGMSKALSTNVVHYRALSLAVKLAEGIDSAAAARYSQWASELKTAINQHFWDQESGMYVSYLFDNKGDIQSDKFDMLGESLAIISGIASDEQARQIMQNYPHSQFGVPVYFPQQPGIPVYHNRAIWPFVTAYSLRAANQTKNVAAANNAYRSLIRGAATNLSNMENLEWLSGKSQLLHGDYNQDASLNGPVINSQRQLWSVGGYLNMVIEQVFGLETVGGELRVEPFITGWMRNTVLKNSDEIRLENFSFKGQSYGVTIKLPPLDNRLSGYYKTVSVNREDNEYIVSLGELTETDQTITVIDDVKPYDTDNSRTFSPVEPVLSVNYDLGQVQIEVQNKGDNKVNLYRNNELVKTLTTAVKYDDSLDQGAYACYVAETVNIEGHRSNLSRPVCVGTKQELLFDGEYQPLKEGVETVTIEGTQGVLRSKQSFTVATSGEYDFSALYSNNQGQLNTGITNAVKVLTVKNSQGNKVGGGVLQMGHVGEQQGLRYSTPVSVTLEAGTKYQFEISDHFNMSYLTSNATYTFAGGVEGIVNAADLVTMRVTRH
ncbi:Six-hairpin glycosidase-like protein [Photobacterium sp. SDRW27]|uniref:alpha-L-rhamnosidase-related protein n=1 Tax=Photobacterium obscurum TaxID=2829490 RepID=UPI002242DD83|nr:Six-hairpin glycosidase-like protein [Photobacterium obscurum]MCW8327190.1 Six-hairpin glycosidase-like protein [Photobacterium obscurum]